MSVSGRLAPIVAALPESRPFVGPEELARRAGLDSLVRLGANESAFGPPPKALDAMRAALSHTNWYGDPESVELREALAARHGCGTSNVTVAAGIDDLLGLAVRAYLGPGDATVMTLGSYPTYVYHVVGYGARLETVPYLADGTVQLELLAERTRETGARVVYLANPDNPSGSFAPREALRAFLGALPSDVIVVLDEAYADFVPASDLVSDSEAFADARVVRMRTFSKAFGMAGARIAYALAAPEVGVAFGKIRLQYGVPRTAQIGALAALAEREFVDGVVLEVARGRDEYRALAERLGIATLPSQTNFVCFDLGSRERAEAMVEALLRRGIFVRKPAAAPLDGHIRVTVGTERERNLFADAFEKALAE